MATITKTIKPGGGGDYTSLASAIAGVAYTVGDTINFVCYAGNFAGSDDPSQLDGAVLVTIIAAAGAKHDGTTTQSVALVASCSGAITFGNAISRDASYIIDGIRFTGGPAVDIEPQDSSAMTVTSQNNMFEGDITSNQSIQVVNFGGTLTVNSYNDVFYNSDSGSGSSYVGALLEDISDTVTTTLNIIGSSGYGTGIVNAINIAAIAGGSGGCNVTATIRNNALLSGTYTILDDGAALTLIFDHNASADSSAGTYGGTGNLTNVSPSAAFVSPTTNQRLKAGSVLKGAGVATAITTDNQGRTRSSPPSIGAFEAASGNAILGNGLM